MPNSLIDSGVPILGLKKPEVRCHWFGAQAVITCDCGSLTPIVVPGLDRAGLCTACKQKYVIARFLHTNTDGLVTADVSIAKWAGPLSASRDLDLSHG